MRALVIGANSLSGRYMCEYLQEKGIEYVGTKLASETIESSEKEHIKNMNLLDLASIKDVLDDYAPDYIFNFAAQSSVGLAWLNPGMTVEVNVNGALNLFEAVRTMKKQPVVVLIGAGEEYGRVDFSRMPTNETEKPKPSNIYAATKACQTMLAKIYHKAYGMNLVVARTFNVIGPGQSERFAVSNFCRQAVLIERSEVPPVLHVGNPNIQRDFTDIRDLVRAYWLLGQRGRSGEIYNVGQGHAVDIRTVLRYLQKLLPVEVEISIDRDRMRPIDIPKIEGDIGKLRSDTGWRPNISLEQSIDDMLQYWRDNL